MAIFCKHNPTIEAKLKAFKPLCKAAIVSALCVGGGEVPQPVHLDHHAALLLPLNERVGAGGRPIGTRSTSSKAPVEGGEELAWLFVSAPDNFPRHCFSCNTILCGYWHQPHAWTLGTHSRTLNHQRRLPCTPTDIQNGTKINSKREKYKMIPREIQNETLINGCKPQGCQSGGSRKGCTHRDLCNVH